MAVEPGGIVYGTVTVGALLAAETARSETYPETVAGVGIAMVLYWLAHSYASLTERQAELGTTITLPELARVMVAELWQLVGAVAPLAAVLIWWAAGASLGTAVAAAIWVSASTLLIVELAIGVRLGLRGRQLLAQAALGTLLGVLLIVLKIVLH